MTKIGFVITNHQSESIRPQGRDLLHKCVHSLYHSCDHPFELYVVDNGSEKKLDNTSSVKNHHHIIIEDQSNLAANEIIGDLDILLDLANS